MKSPLLLSPGRTLQHRANPTRIFRRLAHQDRGNNAYTDASPGFELPADQQHDSVKVSPDLRSARAVFPYSIQVGMPFETETSLAAMARLYGEGVRIWWEGGVYRVDYRKDKAGHWKISRLEYDTLSRADYRPGKSYAQPISVSRFDTSFPEDPQGPDDLV